MSEWWLVPLSIILGFVGVMILLWRMDRSNGARELKDILHSPNKKGQLGEGIVRLALSGLPRDKVFEQFDHPEIQGIPDFAVKIAGKYLIIDAKFSMKEKQQYFAGRAKSVSKYITPGLTFPFILVWTTDETYFQMTEDEYSKIYNTGVIVCTTPALLAVVQMTDYFYRTLHVTANLKEAEDSMDIVDRILVANDNARDFLGRGIKQITSGSNNIHTAIKMIKVNTEDLD